MFKIRTMKTLVLIICLLTTAVNAQQIITDTFTVKGNCEQCKKRIENASDIKGVKLAVWNAETKLVKVTYNSSKVNLQTIKDAIASSGHDAGTVVGAENAYKQLPLCCRYRHNKCEAPKN
jgi:periplasmic mercuric ion binding protein